jgi:hypothetical protein|nr:MAG TPA: hypothetical protein [Caudoviricetes sp.]DAV40406.1 MAG TPA: hypothetical protein [Caudoviricetes sp.]
MTYYVVVFVFVVVGIALATLIEMDAELDNPNSKRTPSQIFIQNLILFGIVCPLLGITIQHFLQW